MRLRGTENHKSRPRNSSRGYANNLIPETFRIWCLARFPAPEVVGRAMLVVVASQKWDKNCEAHYILNKSLLIGRVFISQPLNHSISWKQWLSAKSLQIYWYKLPKLIMEGFIIWKRMDAVMMPLTLSHSIILLTCESTRHLWSVINQQFVIGSAQFELTISDRFTKDLQEGFALVMLLNASVLFQQCWRALDQLDIMLWYVKSATNLMIIDKVMYGYGEHGLYPYKMNSGYAVNASGWAKAEFKPSLIAICSSVSNDANLINARTCLIQMNSRFVSKKPHKSAPSVLVQFIPWFCLARAHRAKLSYSTSQQSKIIEPKKSSHALWLWAIITIR